jgi:hypothetical protein
MSSLEVVCSSADKTGAARSEDIATLHKQEGVKRVKKRCRKNTSCPETGAYVRLGNHHPA